LARRDASVAIWWPDLQKSIQGAPPESDATPEESDYNKLDEKGLLNLLEIHFHASAHKLTYVIEESLDESKNNPSQMNFELLAINAERVIKDGRALLAPFHTDITGPVAVFLDKQLPPSELQARLKRGVEIVSRADTERRRKAAYDLIQEEQASLRKMITDQLTMHASGRPKGRR
jgi:hypothetical protein